MTFHDLPVFSSKISNDDHWRIFILSKQLNPQIDDETCVGFVRKQ
jgi:hypothetical protein